MLSWPNIVQTERKSKRLTLDKCEFSYIFILVLHSSYYKINEFISAFQTETSHSELRKMI